MCRGCHIRDSVPHTRNSPLNPRSELNMVLLGGVLEGVSIDRSNNTEPLKSKMLSRVRCLACAASLSLPLFDSWYLCQVLMMMMMMMPFVTFNLLVVCFVTSKFAFTLHHNSLHWLYLVQKVRRPWSQSRATPSKYGIKYTHAHDKTYGAARGRRFKLFGPSAREW